MLNKGLNYITNLGINHLRINYPLLLNLKKSRSFRGDRIQRNFLRQAAAPRCEGFSKFWKVTDVISFGATKPPAHPEDEKGASSQNVGKPSHLDVAVCPRKFQRIVNARLAVRYKVYYRNPALMA